MLLETADIRSESRDAEFKVLRLTQVGLGEPEMGQVQVQTVGQANRPAVE